MRQWTHMVCCSVTNFTLTEASCRPSGGEKMCQFWLLWPLILTPLHPSALNLFCESEPSVCSFIPNFTLISRLCRPVGQEPQNFAAFFKIKHSVVAPTRGVKKKLNWHIQLQTFSHPTTLSSFLNSSWLNGYTVFSTTTKAWRTNKQTLKNIEYFAPNNLCSSNPTVYLPWW